MVCFTLTAHLNSFTKFSSEILDLYLDFIKFIGEKVVLNILRITVPQKVKHRVTICHSNSAPRYIPKKIGNTCPHKNLYMNVHSSIIHNSPKLEIIQRPSVAEWISKMLYIRTRRYHSAIKRNELLTHAIACMNL